MSAMKDAWDDLAINYQQMHRERVNSAQFSRGLDLDDIIDRLWMVAQDRALDDGTHYQYIRAAIEYMEVIRDARLDS